jgi:hypothetical protein
MPESKLSPRRIEAVERQREAVELRMAGHTWQTIADTLGYSNHTGAIHAVEAALKRTLEPATSSFRALTLERLTKILHVFWPMMLQGDYAAARTVMQATADIRKLMGLDSPIQVEHGGNGVPIQHEVVNIDLGDITEALGVLAEVGAIRMAPAQRQLEGAVDGVYTPQADT